MCFDYFMVVVINKIERIVTALWQQDTYMVIRPCSVLYLRDLYAYDRNVRPRVAP